MVGDPTGFLTLCALVILETTPSFKTRTTNAEGVRNIHRNSHKGMRYTSKRINGAEEGKVKKWTTNDG